MNTPVSSPTKRASSGKVSAAKRGKPVPSIVLDLTVQVGACSLCASEIRCPNLGNASITANFEWVCDTCATEKNVRKIKFRGTYANQFWKDIRYADLAFVKVGAVWVIVRHQECCIFCEEPLQSCTQKMTTSKAKCTAPASDNSKYHSGQTCVVHSECVPHCSSCTEIIYDPNDTAEFNGRDYLCSDCCLGRCRACDEEVGFLRSDAYTYCPQEGTYTCISCCDE